MLPALLVLLLLRGSRRGSCSSSSRCRSSRCSCWVSPHKRLLHGSLDKQLLLSCHGLWCELEGRHVALVLLRELLRWSVELHRIRWVRGELTV